MEWISAILGALVAVLGMQLWHWRTLAKLAARVRNLELAMEKLQRDEEQDEDGEPFGRQCVDLSDEYLEKTFGGGISTAPAPITMTQEYTDLPVIRHMTVPGLVTLLPRKSIRLQPSLDGMGLKVVATYWCAARYREQIGVDLHEDMEQVAKNTGPEWELTIFDNAAYQRYEYRLLKHDGIVHE